MGSKFDWAAVDKRIRARRPSWTKDDAAALAAGLKKLPDAADKAESSEVPQPALLGSRVDGESDEEANAELSGDSE